MFDLFTIRRTKVEWILHLMRFFKIQQTSKTDLAYDNSLHFVLTYLAIKQMSFSIKIYFMNNKLNLKQRQKPQITKYFPSRSWRKYRVDKIPGKLIKELTSHSVENSFGNFCDTSKVTAILNQYKGLSLDSDYKKQTNRRGAIHHTHLSITNNYHSLSPKKQITNANSPKKNTQFWATSNIFILKKRKSNEEGRQNNSLDSSPTNKQSQKQTILLKVHGKSHKNQTHQDNGSKQKQINYFPMLSKRGTLKNSKNAFKYKHQTFDPQMNTFYSTKHRNMKEVPKHRQKKLIQTQLDSSSQFLRSKSIFQCREIQNEVKIIKEQKNQLFPHFNQPNRIRFSPWSPLKDEDKDYIFDHQAS